MTRRRRWLAGVAVVMVGMVGMQLVRPERPGPSATGDGPIGEHVTVPADVDRVLRRACGDCHSASTHWPWYASVAPVSWLVVQDVRRGRADLDLSAWATEPDVEPTPDQRLRWMCEETRSGAMPPWPYLVLHPGARPSEAEVDRLCAWSDAARAKLRGMRGGHE